VNRRAGTNPQLNMIDMIAAAASSIIAPPIAYTMRRRPGHASI
jgi:hypothetical protein